MTRIHAVRILLTVGVLLAAALPAANAAGAVTVGTLAAAPTFGPFLGGDGVVWAQTRPDHSAADVMTQAPGGQARAIGTIPERPGASTDQLQVDVSGGYLAYSYFAQDFGGHGEDMPLYTVVAVGPVAGPYQPLASCTRGGGDYRFSLSGGTIAYRAGCAPPGPPLTIRDLATGAEQPFAAPPFSEFKLAGDFLAFRTDADSTAITVYNRSSGAEVYRGGLTGPSMPVSADFGLQADGKLAVSVEANLSATMRAAVISWFSPAEPVPHVLPQPQVAAATSLGLYYLPVQLAGDTIVYTRPESPCNYNGLIDLVEADLQGDVRLIDRVAAVNPVAFDFDGQTVVWLGNRGGVPTLLAQNLTTDVPPLTAAEPANCPTLLPASARVVEKAIRLRPGGKSAHMLVACLNPAQAGQKSSSCSLKIDVRSAHRVRLTPRSRPAVVQFVHGSTLDLIPLDVLSGPHVNVPQAPIGAVLQPAMQGTIPILIDAKQRSLLRRVRRLGLTVTLTDYFTHAVVARAPLTLIYRR